MGVRIEAFAVDVPRLDALLDASLADLLLLYQRDGNEPDERLTFIAENDDHFVATPGGPIRAAITGPSGRCLEELTADQVRSIGTLSRTARVHLSRDCNLDSMWLLLAFSNCKGINFIERVIDGHRRWWVGSLLQAARVILPDAEYAELLMLFRKVLRGANCGYPIPEGDVYFEAAALPFLPCDDPDTRFGRWDDRDCRRGEELLRLVSEKRPTFTRPSGPIGIAPDDSEWHEWVEENVAAILRLADLEYEVCNLLTFIG